MKRIYLDHAATTKPDLAVLKAMNLVNQKFWGNPSSIHSFGQEARSIVDQSRRVVAEFLSCSTEEVIFTSGGSESDNFAIKGLVEAFYGNNQVTRNNNQTNPNNQIPNLKLLKPKTYNQIPHIITSAFEHHAVLDTILELERNNQIEATYIKPNSKGIIQVEDVKKAIKPNTLLVSIMYVNNEIGTLQPIKEIGKMVKKINSLASQQISPSTSSGQASQQLAKKPANYQKIFFHTDAVQAAEYFTMNVAELHVDMLTFTAHKIYGPKGVGVLYVKSGTPIKHQIIGGGQEFKKRAGTENLAGIVGLAEAIRQVDKKLDIKNKKYIETRLQLRDRLIDGLLKNIKDCSLNGDKELRSPGNVSVSVKNAEGEALLLNLDLQGIAASSGSACTSGALEPSHVLLSIGIPAEVAHGSIRFTLGRETTKEEIDRVIKIFPKIVDQVRKMSPF